jgi:hypothetical protein
MRKLIPAYATIPILGGQATVTFRVHDTGNGGSSSGSHTGYDIGALLEQYVGSGIPVIDMRTAETYRFPPRYCRDTSILGPHDKPYDYYSIDEYVDHYRGLGATIHYLTDASVLMGILGVMQHGLVT